MTWIQTLFPSNMDCHSSTCKHIAKGQRTSSRNNAIHLYFQLLADELNCAGLPIKNVIGKYNIDLEWDTQSVKDLILRPIQKALLHKSSTTELSKQEDIDKVYDHINRFIGESFGIHVPFPVDEERQKEKQYGIQTQNYEYPTTYEEPSFWDRYTGDMRRLFHPHHPGWKERGMSMRSHRNH